MTSGDVAPAGSLTFAEVARTLRDHHGPPALVPTTDPFELVLLENVAYLASPAMRREAFEVLRRTVGTEPRRILKAGKAALERVTARGILKGRFAEKLLACARIALDHFDGDLAAATRRPIDEAIRALRQFPGIGEPGAEKILLFSGLLPFLAPDSNGLRVLARLGLVREETSYARTYAASRSVAEGWTAGIEALQEAHLLLKEHGQTLCRRTAPRCEACPLETVCAHARAAGPGRRGAVARKSKR
jgi:endonuclease III